MKEYVLPIAFLLAPFAILSTGFIWTGQQIGLMIIFLVLMATMIENKWLRAFLFYAIAWQVFLFAQAMIHPYKFQAAIASGYTQVLFMTAGAMIYLTASKSKIGLQVFYNVICIAALIQTVIALLQKFGGVDIVPMVLSLIAPTKSALGEGALVGFLGNPNFLAAYLAISLPFFFRKSEHLIVIMPRFYFKKAWWGRMLHFKIRWYYGIIPLVPVLYLANTTSAFIPAVIGTLYFFWTMRKVKLLSWILFPVLVIGGLYYAFIYHPFLANPRWGLWFDVLKQVFANPFTIIFGFGPGAGWGQSFPMHNEWLQCIHQFGVIGFALLVGYVLTIYRGNRILFTAFLIAAINMFGNYSLHLAPSAFLICIIAGLMERERSQCNA